MIGRRGAFPAGIVAGIRCRFWYIPVYTDCMLFIEKVCQALADHDVRYALVGGHAVALHGAVRGTVDVDIVVDWSLKSLQRAEAALHGLGLVSHLPISAEDVFNYRDEYVDNRNLAAWNFHHPEDVSQQVDIIIVCDLKGKRRSKIRTASGQLYLLSLRDLVDMKKASARPQDLADVDALERLK